MDSYSLLREIADSWVLLFLVLFFVGVIVWVFRPGSTPMHENRHIRPEPQPERHQPLARQPAIPQAVQRDQGGRGIGASHRRDDHR